MFFMEKLIILKVDWGKLFRVLFVECFIILMRGLRFKKVVSRFKLGIIIYVFFEVIFFVKICIFWLFLFILCWKNRIGDWFIFRESWISNRLV